MKMISPRFRRPQYLGSLLRVTIPALIFLISLGSLAAAAPESMQFDSLTFRKAFTDKSSEGPFSEYLPKGQALKSWTKLMGYYEFPALKNPKEAAQMVEEVVKKQNPDAQSEVVYNSTTNEAIVDFVTWPKDQSYVEFNIWKYRKSPNGGLVAIQYAERASSDLEAYFKKLASRRETLRNEMAKFTP